MYVCACMHRTMCVYVCLSACLSVLKLRECCLVYIVTELIVCCVRSTGVFSSSSACHNSSSFPNSIARTPFCWPQDLPQPCYTKNEIASMPKYIVVNKECFVSFYRKYSVFNWCNRQFLSQWKILKKQKRNDAAWFLRQWEKVVSSSDNREGSGFTDMI